MTPVPPLFSLYDQFMWDSVEAGALKLQRCTLNGAFRFPPGPVDPETLSPDYTWEAVSGRATLLSWTTFHRQYLPGFPPPHTVAMVRLEEGPVMVATVAPALVPALRIDMAVQLDYAEGPNGSRLTTIGLRPHTGP